LVLLLLGKKYSYTPVIAVMGVGSVITVMGVAAIAETNYLQVLLDIRNEEQTHDATYMSCFSSCLHQMEEPVQIRMAKICFKTS